MVLGPSKVNVRSADPILPLKIQNSNAFNGFFCRCWVLSGSALTDHERRALLRATDADTRRLWFLSPTHTTNGTSPPNMAADLHRGVRSSRRRVHVGKRPCVVVGGLPLTNAHNALPRWCLRDHHHPRCAWEGAGRPWTWLCGRRAAAEARRPTEAHTREEGRTSRMTKISGLGCQQTPF